jgi:hypothetical protein
MGLAELFDLSARTGGPIHLATAAADAVVDVRTLRRHAAEQGWWRPYPGVAAPPGTPQTPWTRARAAAVYLGAAADPAAARRPGRPRARHRRRWASPAGPPPTCAGSTMPRTTRVQVVLPHGRRIEPRRHLDVRVSRTLHSEHIAVGAPGPAGDPGPDAARPGVLCEVDRLLAMLIDLRHRGEVEIAELERLLATTRFPGCGVLRAAVEMLASAGRTDSIFELRARRRLTAEHVPLDRGQVEVPTPIGPIHLDLGCR